MDQKTIKLILLLDYCLTDPSLHRRIYQTLVSSDLQSSNHEIFVLGPPKDSKNKRKCFSNFLSTWAGLFKAGL